MKTSVRASRAATWPDWWYRETLSSTAVALAVAVLGAVLIGGLTSFGQQYLPAWLNSLANSAGGWTMFSFLLVWLGRARPLLAAVLGVLVFQLLVEAYSVVSEWRGFPDGDPFSSIWTLVGLVCGPLLGATASLTRYGSPLWRVLAVTPLGAVLLGEGVYGLIAIADTTSPVYWYLEIVLGVAFIVIANIRHSLPWRQVLLVEGVWLGGSAGFLWFYLVGLN